MDSIPDPAKMKAERDARTRIVDRVRDMLFPRLLKSVCSVIQAAHERGDTHVELVYNPYTLAKAEYLPDELELIISVRGDIVHGAGRNDIRARIRALLPSEAAHTLITKALEERSALYVVKETGSPLSPSLDISWG